MLAQVIIDAQQCLESTFTERFINPILPYCELFYYLSGIGLFVVAIIGLRQITLGRQIANLSAKRDALKIAAEQCRLYADTILPSASKLLTNPKYTPYIHSYTFSVEKSSILVRPLKADVEQKKIPLDSDFLKIFNAIESFSQFFTSGIADEEDAYYCLGNAHLAVVGPFVPFLVLRDQEDHEQNWRNTLKLFVNWHARQQQEIIERKKRELSEQKELLEKEKALHDPKPIRVLDVDSFYNWSANAGK